MYQKLVPCISKARVDQLELDFSPTTIVAKTAFYDRILEAVVKRPWQKSAYLAGHEYFIKFKEPFNTTTFRQEPVVESVQLYIQIADNKTEFSVDETELEKDIGTYTNQGLTFKKENSGVFTGFIGLDK